MFLLLYLDGQILNKLSYLLVTLNISQRDALCSERHQGSSEKERARCLGTSTHISLCMFPDKISSRNLCESSVLVATGVELWLLFILVTFNVLHTSCLMLRSLVFDAALQVRPLIDRTNMEMNNWIGPTVKHVWDVAMHVLHNFGVCHKHNSLPQPSSPTSKELHGTSVRYIIAE